MKTLNLLAVVVALSTCFLCARPTEPQVDQSQLKWFLLTEAEPIATHAGPFLSVVFVDKNNGVAISPITINKTNDGGTNWSAVKNWDENNRGFSALIFATGQLWIVGSESGRPLILRTKANGFQWEDWQKIDLKGKKSVEVNSKFTSFSDMCFDGLGNAWIVGDAGVVQLNPRGVEWEISTLYDSQDRLYSVSCNGSGEVWAVGENSTTLHYQNGW
jgi:photosystem II stability/assembly factor-like uncharacterized protein